MKRLSAVHTLTNFSLSPKAGHHGHVNVFVLRLHDDAHVLDDDDLLQYPHYTSLLRQLDPV